MKLRAQTKIVKGKPRWYLVSSYRDKNTGKPCTRHHLYLGVSPNPKMEILIERINESVKKYGKPLYTGKEFQQIRQINLRLREEEKWKLWRTKQRAKEATEWEKNATERHHARLRQRREVYALKIKLKPGERLPSNRARFFGAISELGYKLTNVRVDLENSMIFEYGPPEKWRPDFKVKVFEQLAWIEDLKNAVRNSRRLQMLVQTGKRLPLHQARKISGFALLFSRLMAAKEALRDAIQEEGQPDTWSDSAKERLEWEFENLERILNKLKS